MSCHGCHERGGSARCEGCQLLYCLPCINKHQDALMQQFQSIVDARNRLKEALDAIVSTTNKQTSTHRALLDIDRWETAMMKTIHGVATKLREDVHQAIMNKGEEIQKRVDEVSSKIQEKQKREIYLENHIEVLTQQLTHLREEVNEIGADIEVRTQPSEDLDWKSLVCIQVGNMHQKSMMALGHHNSETLYEKATPSEPFVATIPPVTDSDPEDLPNLYHTPARSPGLSRSLCEIILMDANMRTKQEHRCVTCGQPTANLLSNGYCDECNDLFRQRNLFMQNQMPIFNMPLGRPGPSRFRSGGRTTRTNTRGCFRGRGGFRGLPR